MGIQREEHTEEKKKKGMLVNHHVKERVVVKMCYEPQQRGDSTICVLSVHITIPFIYHGIQNWWKKKYYKADVFVPTCMHNWRSKPP